MLGCFAIACPVLKPLRHEGADVFVTPEHDPGRNPVFCYGYPTKTCDPSNWVVRKLLGQCTLTREGGHPTREG